MIQIEKPRRETKEHDEIVEHGRDAGGEQIVQRVNVCSGARNQPAHRIPIEKAEGQALQVLEDLLAQVVHDLLADPLHDAYLRILQPEAGHNGDDERADNPPQAGNRTRPGDGCAKPGMMYQSMPMWKRYGPTSSMAATPSAMDTANHTHQRYGCRYLKSRRVRCVS